MTANRFRFRAWDSVEQLMFPIFSLQGGVIPYSLSDKAIVIMQSTGLCDKNGKEVFEGDILEAEPGRLINPLVYRDDIRWDQEAAAFTFTWSPHTAKIIGNIYEHPELLQLEDKIIFESGASITLTGKK